MKNFFRKKDVNTEESADFVLFGMDDEDTSGTQPEQIDNFDDTADFDVSKVVSALEEQNKNNKFSERKQKFSSFVLNRKKTFVAIVSVLILALLAGSVFGIVEFANPLRGYAQVAATKENIAYTIDVEGTLALGNKHNITSLVSGKIISSKFEVGDEVKAGDELYKLDDTEAKLVVEKAKNEVNKTSDSSYGITVARITSTDAGVVQTLNIKEGSMVSPGMQVGTVKKSDGTTSSIIAYVSGKVTIVSVRTGQSLSSGQIVASVNTTTNGDYSPEYDKKSSEIDLQTAQRHLENYSIKSPVKGKIIEKNLNVGDNVGVTDSDRPMMVIVDTSSLNFTFKVDEYRLREIRKGQSATITVDSFPDETFSGEVSSFSNEGIPDENGNLLFDVTITIDKPKDLKAGMSVKATVTLASVKNSVSIPQNALIESDGETALVFVKDENPDEIDDKVLTESLENELEFPHINIPDGCYLYKVEYGISNGNLVQIISGLNPGDIVVYNPKKDNAFVKTTKDIDEFFKGNNKNKTNNKPASTMDKVEEESDSLPTEESTSTEENANADDNNEEIENQLQNEIEKILGTSTDV